MKSVDRPIGVFDSGFGGVSVFKAIRKALPRERLVYFGDTAHLPYGSKSPEAVRAFAAQIADYLIGEKGIKLLVVACNTASSFALGALQGRLKVPVVGVIEPGAEAALRATRNKVVGVIGTEGTVSSHAYRDALRRVDSSVQVHEQACPLFVPLVEEGFWNGEVTARVAARYLAPLRRTRCDTVILGCTHYPFLKRVVQKAVGGAVTLVDSGEATARRVREILDHMRLARKTGTGTGAFIVSDAPRRFARLARRFLGRPVGTVQVKRFS